MRQEENIVGIEMSPNTFIKGCKTSIKDIELVAHSDLNIDYNLNKHEYMTGQVVWGFPKEVLCDNQDELEQEEFGYSVIKDIDAKRQRWYGLKAKYVELIIPLWRAEWNL